MGPAPRSMASSYRETVTSVSYLSSVKKTAADNPTAVWQCAEMNLSSLIASVAFLLNTFFIWPDILINIIHDQAKQIPFRKTMLQTHVFS